MTTEFFNNVNRICRILTCKAAKEIVIDLDRNFTTNVLSTQTKFRRLIIYELSMLKM